MSKDRRKHPRVRAKGLTAHLRAGHGRAACQVENISLGGLFVRTDRLEEVGSEISVDIVRPGWKRQLTIAARVTSRVDAADGRLSKRMPGMGLQFLQLDDKQHQRLGTLLRELGAPDESAEVTLAEGSSSTVEDAIAAALGEADLPAPGPVVLDPDPPPPPSALPGDEARLITQLRGLVMQLSDAQQQLAQRDAEIEKLRDELETTRSALQRALRDG